VPQQERDAFKSKTDHMPTPINRIGTFVSGCGVVVKRDDGSEITFDRKGWDHF